MANRRIAIGKGDLFLRLVRAEINRRQGGIHGQEPERERQELALLLEALNREEVRIPLDCEDEAPPEVSSDFDTICDTSCCRIQPKTTRRKQR